MNSYPYLLDYTPKDYIWGGTKLKKEWNKKASSRKIAESWELSINPNCNSIVLNGDNKGKTLKDIIMKNPEILGSRGIQHITFPVLIKLINAEKNLSIQVHPDNEYALLNESKLGKCEMWYICDADDGAEIYLGFKESLSIDDVLKAIDDNEIEKYLNRIKVKRGEYYLVPAGTLHAIRGGITLIEIQQNSDVTYRVYDYNRKGKDGKKRELHIDKALDVMDYNKYDIPLQNEKYKDFGNYKIRELVNIKHFTTNEIIINEKYDFYCKDSFIAFTVVEGSGKIGKYDIEKGNTVFIPADCKETIKGKMTLITVNV